MPRISVTLVHGTFASDAAWTRPDSLLSAALNSPPVNADIAAFGWSGRNTVRARREGARGLEAYLSARVAAEPEAEHYVIAHSHGGNVALLALRDPALASRVSGVVCLSTPFLVTRWRDLGPSGLLQLYAFAGIVFAGVGLSTLHRILDLAVPGFTVTLFTKGGAELGGVLILFLVPIFAALGIWVVRRWQAASERVYASMRLDPPPVPVLIIRTPADEASALLGGMYFSAWLTRRVWVFASALVERIAEPVRRNGRRFLQRTSWARLPCSGGEFLAFWYVVPFAAPYVLLDAVFESYQIEQMNEVFVLMFFLLWAASGIAMGAARASCSTWLWRGSQPCNSLSSSSWQSAV